MIVTSNYHYCPVEKQTKPSYLNIPGKCYSCRDYKPKRTSPWRSA